MVHTFDITTLSSEGVFVTDFLTVKHLPEVKYLEVKWSQPVNSEEFRKGMEAVVNNILDLGIELLLIDFRKTGIPSLADQNWLVRLMVSANKITPLKRSARLLSRDIMQHLIHEVIVEKVEVFPYQVSIFDCEVAAKQWLFKTE